MHISSRKRMRQYFIKPVSLLSFSVEPWLSDKLRSDNEFRFISSEYIFASSPMMFSHKRFLRPIRRVCGSANILPNRNAVSSTNIRIVTKCVTDKSSKCEP